jgi:hypothetical protein
MGFKVEDFLKPKALEWFVRFAKGEGMRACIYCQSSRIAKRFFFLLHNLEAQYFFLFFFSAEVNYEANFIFFTCTNPWWVERERGV